MKFNIIYADPPWRFQNWSIGELAKRGEKWARRNGRSPYNVMDTAAICDLPVQAIANNDCVLFLWATHPKIEDALAVIKAWGFQYKTVAFTWVKTNPSGLGWHFGLGYWTRQNPELCLLATKGHPHRVNNSVPNLVIGPRGKHSAKPSIVRERIVELVGDLPRVELFARERVDGWISLGYEINGQDMTLALQETSSCSRKYFSETR